LSFLHEVSCGNRARFADRWPFSFIYGGRQSGAFLAEWPHSTKIVSSDEDQIVEETIFVDTATGLEVRLDTKRFASYSAVEWMLTFANRGSAGTPIIESVLALDLTIDSQSGDIVLHHAHGSTWDATDFLPVETPLQPNGRIDIAPRGGRSSEGALPFFNLQHAGGGLVGAIGWTGQWKLQANRDEVCEVTLAAGQESVHLTLHPGETMRTPSVLLVGWEGSDRLFGHNTLRRLLLAHYLPRIDNTIAVTPIAMNTWFKFNEGNDVTEDNQLEAISAIADAGFEHYWLDAGWFEGGWPKGAGSWMPKKDAFPRGIRPIADAAHRAGLKFVLWFEPERVGYGTAIATEHPEWILHNGDSDRSSGLGGLFNLGDPDALAWMTDFLTERLVGWDVDVFRNDFNIPPQPFWQRADSPDRIGITENHYIAGLYTLWDELLRRKPGLTIDNCASGGRRIDIETIKRSYPLWQSDTPCCGHDMPIWNQVQNAGLSLYLPQHASGAWLLDHYNFRSVATSGFALCSDIVESAELRGAARRAAEEVRSLRPYYLGDYYPLLPITLDESAWSASQHHRADLDEGFFVLLRREKSPYIRSLIALQGLDPTAPYRLTDFDTGRTWTELGSDLALGRPYSVEQSSAAVLIRYAKA
jgi:alpha-galactosidase